MTNHSATDISQARINAARTAADPDKAAHAISLLTDADLTRLTRSLEFEGILDGHPPDLLQAMRPRLRQLRPARVMSLERLCWVPVQRFLVDRMGSDPRAPWIVPRRLLSPLWQALERREADLVDQLRRRLLVALFDDDPAEVERIGTQIGDLAAFFLNNMAGTGLPGVQPGDHATIAFMARVLKWHRPIMPNVRYYQQAARANAMNTVQSLRLHSNWFPIYELLDGQFDLYVLYLFEMTDNPIDVIDAFPFYFDTLTRADGLAMDWLAYRCDRLAGVVGDLAAKPVRTQPPEVLFDLFEALHELTRLVDRCRRIRLFTGRPRAALKGIGDALMRRVHPDAVDRLVDAYLDDLHDLLVVSRIFSPRRNRARAARLLPRFSVALPLLLDHVDTGEKGSRAARARFRLGEKILDTTDRFLRNTDLAPATRRSTGQALAPALDLCRRLGRADDADGLFRRLRR